MSDGHIRGHDTRKGTGASEAHITHAYGVSDTFTTQHCPKLLITDERVNTAIQEAAKRL